MQAESLPQHQVRRALAGDTLRSKSRQGLPARGETRAEPWIIAPDREQSAKALCGPKAYLDLFRTSSADQFLRFWFLINSESQ
jgi:hypothetical protein